MTTYLTTGSGDLNGASTATLNLIDDVTNSAPADKHVLVFDGITDNKYENRLLLESDISDFGDYATLVGSPPVVPDANISESSVSQYLGSYLQNITNESLGDLSDVSFGSPVATDGQILEYDSATESWVVADAAAGATNYEVKTTTYTAVDGDFLLCDCSTGWTLTLPASPSSTDFVIIDVVDADATNYLTIDPNGETIEDGSVDENMTVTDSGLHIRMVFDGTIWRVTS